MSALFNFRPHFHLSSDSPARVGVTCGHFESLNCKLYSRYWISTNSIHWPKILPYMVNLTIAASHSTSSKHFALNHVTAVLRNCIFLTNNENIERNWSRVMYGVFHCIAQRPGH